MSSIEPGQSAPDGDPVPPQRLTSWLARRAMALQYRDLTADAVDVARQCILDTIGVAIAGAREPEAELAFGRAQAEGGEPVSGLIGRSLRLPPRQAAWVNGTASHALDYDDNNLTMPGHVSAVVLPAVLALGEARRLDGEALVTAFAAGFETGCSLGATMSPGHYARGFHATATHGAIAAAAACAKVMQLDPARAADALSIAATMAAGLKGLFGTQCKPLHAGFAAQNAVLAAQLAAEGLKTRGDAIECAQGYAATHAPEFDPAAAARPPRAGYHLLDNLFKFHAACYGTHGAIECALRLIRQVDGNTARIRSLVLETAEGNDTVCNIADPSSAAEARFSLRHVVAMALCGYDTAKSASYGGTALGDPEVARLRQAIRVHLIPTDNIGEARLHATLDDGRTVASEHDAGRPAQDLSAQRERLQSKFQSLVTPVIGDDGARALMEMIGGIERVDDACRRLVAATVR